MPRARDPARDKAYEIYKQQGGEIALTAIAELLELPAATVRSWRSRDKWEQRLHGKVTPKKQLKKDCSVAKKRCNKTGVANAPNVPAVASAGPISDEAIQAEVEQLIANDQLTDMQRLFCAHYIRCFSPQKAARAAGYSHKYANRIGWALLQKAPVKAEVDRLRAQKLTTAMLSVDDIFDRMLTVATASINDFAKVREGYMSMKTPDEYDGSLIKKIKMTDTGMSLELHDQQKAWEWLADHMGMLSEAQRRQYELARDRLELEKQKNSILDKAVDGVKILDDIENNSARD